MLSATCVCGNRGEVMPIADSVFATRECSWCHTRLYVWVRDILSNDGRYDPSTYDNSRNLLSFQASAPRHRLRKWAQLCELKVVSDNVLYWADPNGMLQNGQAQAALDPTTRAGLIPGEIAILSPTTFLGSLPVNLNDHIPLNLGQISNTPIVRKS